MGVAFQNTQSSTGIATITAPAGGALTTWNLTSLSISQAGPTLGPNAKVTIYDGTVATGTVIYAAFLSGPGGTGGTASVGIIQDIPLPKTTGSNGVQAQSLQATPGNAMTIQVTGTGNNQVSINARFSDGIPA